jgi:hypothetical protein
VGRFRCAAMLRPKPRLAPVTRAILTSSMAPSCGG